jgi:hypothetical protein
VIYRCEDTLENRRRAEGGEAVTSAHVAVMVLLVAPPFPTTGPFLALSDHLPTSHLARIMGYFVCVYERQHTRQTPRLARTSKLKL